ncbi:hypothetical protein D3C75_749450 [compost metagenome]
MKLGGVGNHAVQIEDHCLELPGKRNPHRFLRKQRQEPVSVFDLKACSFQQCIDGCPAVHEDVQQLAAGRNLETVALPLLRQRRTKTQLSVILAHSAEAVHNRHPGACHCGHVQPVLGVAVDIIQIHPYRTVEVSIGSGQIADFGGDNTMNARRQGRIVSRQRLIILIIADFIGQAELIAEQEQGHDQIGLLQHLVAVDDQRVIVQQQRIFICRGPPEIPFLLAQERIILRINAQRLVKRDKHLLRSFQPAVCLLRT